MSGWKVVMPAVIVALLMAGIASVTLAQEGGQGGRRRFDPGQMRQRYMDRIKETLGASDEEWAVLEPRIQKVQELSMQTRAGGRGGMFGGRGARGGGDAPAPERELTPVQTATQGLQTILEDEAASAEDIQAKLTALREAREKAKQEVAKAQAELREVLTIRQEAQLVVMGMLE